MNDALGILRAVDSGARLLVGDQGRDVTTSARKAFRAVASRPGVDPAAAATRVLERVVARADREVLR